MLLATDKFINTSVAYFFIYEFKIKKIKCQKNVFFDKKWLKLSVFWY